MSKNKTILLIICVMVISVVIVAAVFIINGKTTGSDNEEQKENAQNTEATALPNKENNSLIRGVDISVLEALENVGITYKDRQGKEEDIFQILKNAGINYIRIRIWNNPKDNEGNSYGGGNCDLKNAKKLGVRATKAGMKVFVDFHYSDFWADPAKQYVPLEWKNLNVDEKSDKIYEFTYESLKELLEEDIDIGMVQIGNETNSSMCGEGGIYDEVWDFSSGVGQMMKSGCKAVDEINEEYNRDILKVLHFTDLLSNGEWYAKCIDALGVEYDVFATSFYPMWHGSVEEMSKVLEKIARTYDKKVLVAETGYPYTYENYDDQNNNIGDESGMICKDYEVSIKGQSKAIKAVLEGVDRINEIKEGYGLGAFYWEPGWIAKIEDADGYKKSGAGWATKYSGEYEKEITGEIKYYADKDSGTSWDNMTLFDKNGVALESLYEFGG